MIEVPIKPFVIAMVLIVAFPIALIALSVRSARDIESRTNYLLKFESGQFRLKEIRERSGNHLVAVDINGNEIEVQGDYLLEKVKK